MIQKEITVFKKYNLKLITILPILMFNFAIKLEAKQDRKTN